MKLIYRRAICPLYHRYDCHFSDRTVFVDHLVAVHLAFRQQVSAHVCQDNPVLQSNCHISGIQNNCKYKLTNNILLISQCCAQVYEPHMTGCKFYTQRNIGTRLIRSNNDTLSIFATVLVWSWLW